MNDNEHRLDIFIYRSLVADFYDIYCNELEDGGAASAAVDMQKMYNHIKQTNFSRFGNVDDIIRWHKDTMQHFPVYHGFISRGYMFLVAHLKSLNDFDALTKLNAALASAVALSFVPDGQDIYHNPTTLTAEYWSREVLATTGKWRFLTFALMLQITTLNQPAQEAPAGDGQ